MKAEQRLYLNEAGDAVVPEGDPAASTLWKAEGDEITPEEARQYDLARAKLGSGKDAEADADEDAVEGKAVEGPPASKAGPRPDATDPRPPARPKA